MSIYSIHPVNNIYLFCLVLSVCTLHSLFDVYSVYVCSGTSMGCDAMLFDLYCTQHIQYILFFSMFNRNRGVVLLLFEFIELLAVNGIDVRMCASTLWDMRFQRIQTHTLNRHRNENGCGFLFGLYLVVFFFVLLASFPFSLRLIWILWIYYEFYNSI